MSQAEKPSKEEKIHNLMLMFEHLGKESIILRKEARPENQYCPHTKDHLRNAISVRLFGIATAFCPLVCSSCFPQMPQQVDSAIELCVTAKYCGMSLGPFQEEGEKKWNLELYCNGKGQSILPYRHRWLDGQGNAHYNFGWFCSRECKEKYILQGRAHKVDTLVKCSECNSILDPRRLLARTLPLESKKELKKKAEPDTSPKSSNKPQKKNKKTKQKTKVSPIRRCDACEMASYCSLECEVKGREAHRDYCDLVCKMRSIPNRRFAIPTDQYYGFLKTFEAGGDKIKKEGISDRHILPVGYPPTTLPEEGKRVHIVLEEKENRKYLWSVLNAGSLAEQKSLLLPLSLLSWSKSLITRWGVLVRDYATFNILPPSLADLQGLGEEETKKYKANFIRLVASTNKDLQVMLAHRGSYLFDIPLPEENKEDVRACLVFNTEKDEVIETFLHKQGQRIDGCKRTRQKLYALATGISFFERGICIFDGFGTQVPNKIKTRS